MKIKHKLVSCMITIILALILISCQINENEPDVVKYTVVVDGQSYVVLSGESLPNIEEPTKNGYMFLGWFDGENLFDIKKPIDKDYQIVSKFEIIINRYSISLVLNDSVYEGSHELSFLENEIVVLDNPIKEGYDFLGWFIDNDFNEKFNLKYLNNDITIYAKFQKIDNDNLNAGSYLESIYALFNDPEPSKAKAYYKNNNEEDWNLVDKELIRHSIKDNYNSRVDIVGLKKGYYDLKIVTSLEETLIKENIYTDEHDRSGYAHFKYNEGIGGYKDDGTIKENAFIIYVTEENKNDIQIPGVNKIGLGWILNNAQYSKQGSSTYNLADSNESISKINYPLIIRFIGKVTAPLGVTGYDSLINGGSVGDNGNLVRIKDANHITIEGIGEDAVIEGWGFHFMASNKNRGIGFHARNLTFDKYPEDAIGLEGVQESGKLTAPVQRGWMHHLTFLPGYSSNPAESDKAFGDGSLDIKRGEYFTISYTKFIGAHKTNLVGASDDNLQYHITYHHNWWQNNASRIPLARKANIHMYNNFFEITDDNPNEPSYAQNTRANAYIFSEANYFYGTKSPSDVRSGAIKSYNDVKYSTYNLDGSIKALNRNQAVSSGNLYENFDTNKDVFYYDDINQKTSVKYLTDAITARKDVVEYAGTYKVYKTDLEKIRISDITPINITENINVTTMQKINKGEPLLVFKIDQSATFKMVEDGSSTSPVLVDIYGKTILLGTGSAQLEKGIYVLESSISHGASKSKSQAKESGLNSYSITLDSEEQSKIRIENYHKSIEDIGYDFSYSIETLNKLNIAKDNYNNLKDNEKLLINNTELTNLFSLYYEEGRIYFESKIDQIDLLNPDFDEIITIRNEYEKSLEEVKKLVSNIHILNEAEEILTSNQISYLNKQISQINDFENIHNLTLTKLKEKHKIYQDLLILYMNLNNDKKLLIEDIDKLNSITFVIEKIILVNEFIIFIDNIDLAFIDMSKYDDFMLYYKIYLNLEENEKEKFTEEQLNKIEKLYDIYTLNKGKTYYFIPEMGVNTDNYFAYLGDAFINNAGTFEVDGNLLTNAIKLNSSATLSFQTEHEIILILYVKTRSNQSDGSININGTIYQIESTNTLTKIEVVLPVGEHIIKRANRELALYYVEIIKK